MMLKTILMVGLGGFVGSVLRYLISVGMAPMLSANGIPWQTLLVNVIGSLLIGVLVAAAVSENWYALAAVGFCGGFTTFSTFSLELVRMLRASHYSTAVAYVLLSLVLTVAAVALGYWITSKILIVK